MNTEVDALKERIAELEEENAILKVQQVEINEAKELYLKIFEDFPALIWRSRLDKLCDYFNKTWLDFTGRTMEQEFGNGWAEGVHPEDFDLCLKTYVEAFDLKQSFSMEYRMKNKFGEYRWIRDFGRPFYDIDNTFLGYIGSCYDITDNKNNLLKLLELNATKDKFFSIIAHDLKTPFNSIIGFSEQLVEQIDESNYENIKDYAGYILHSSNQAMNLLTDLMEWEHTQSGKLEFKPELLNIGRLIQEIEHFMSDSALQKGINLSNNSLHDVVVFADKAMVSTVLRNLISNAIKFTRQDGEIHISTVIRSDECIVSVSDNGVGISKERLDKLFHIGETYSTRGTQNEKGSGLGLILCQEFVAKNNGKIWAESKIGEGSTFNFSVPLANPNI